MQVSKKKKIFVTFVFYAISEQNWVYTSLLSPAQVLTYIASLVGSV